jgi:hypothetical protein
MPMPSPLRDKMVAALQKTGRAMRTPELAEACGSTVVNINQAVRNGISAGLFVGCKVERPHGPPGWEIRLSSKVVPPVQALKVKEPARRDVPVPPGVKIVEEERPKTKLHDLAARPESSNGHDLVEAAGEDPCRRNAHQDGESRAAPASKTQLSLRALQRRPARDAAQERPAARPRSRGEHRAAAVPAPATAWRRAAVKTSLSDFLTKMSEDILAADDRETAFHRAGFAHGFVTALGAMSRLSEKQAEAHIDAYTQLAELRIAELLIP